jgi:hypothetical protein
MTSKAIGVSPGAGGNVRFRTDPGDGFGDIQTIDTAPWPETGVVGAQGPVTVAGTVVKSGAGLTIPAGATHCYLSVEANSIRFFNTGDAPTAAKGHLLTAGAGPLEFGNVANLQMIAQSASATVQISYHNYT